MNNNEHASQLQLRVSEYNFQTVPPYSAIVNVSPFEYSKVTSFVPFIRISLIILSFKNALTIDPLRQFLRLIRSDNFYDQSAETISTMRRMMTSESSPQVAKCSIEQYLILIKCLYCKIAIIKIDIFC